MPHFPKSPKDAVGGMRYFPRLLDKIRLHARGELPEEYHRNMGRAQAADGVCLNFLRIDYDTLKERVLAGGSDEEMLEWCYSNGRRLNEGDLVVWNSFILKHGWNDFATAVRDRLKQEAGLAERDDIQTIGDITDFEEGRLK